MPAFIFRLIVPALALLTLCGSANAMSVTPTLVDMTTAGGKAQISVLNDGATRLPVEILVSRIELNEAGETTAKPAGDEFLIFPPQALVAAGASQSFRIQWVGDPAIRQTQSYIFSVNQVPVKMPAGESGVQVVFNFSTVVNVDPPGGKAGITLVTSGLAKDDKGRTRPMLTVKNPGNAHAKLIDATIQLSGGSPSGGSWSHTLRPEQLRQVMGVGLVQPGKSRRFLLPVDLPPGIAQLTASVDYKPVR